MKYIVSVPLLLLFIICGCSSSNLTPELEQSLLDTISKTNLTINTELKLKDTSSISHFKILELNQKVINTKTKLSGLYIENSAMHFSSVVIFPALGTLITGILVGAASNTDSGEKSKVTVAHYFPALIGCLIGVLQYSSAISSLHDAGEILLK